MVTGHVVRRVDSDDGEWCLCQPTHDGHGAEVLLHVNEVYILGQSIPLPSDNTPAVVNNPVPHGVYEDSTVMTVPV